jgi:hypothetical protein
MSLPPPADKGLSPFRAMSNPTKRLETLGYKTLGSKEDLTDSGIFLNPEKTLPGVQTTLLDNELAAMQAFLCFVPVPVGSELLIGCLGSKEELTDSLILRKTSLAFRRPSWTMSLRQCRHSFALFRYQ